MYASEGFDVIPTHSQKSERRASIGSPSEAECRDVREAVVIKATTSLPLPGVRGGVQQSGAILSASSPRAALTIPVGTRGRLNSQTHQTMPSGRRLSFDIPATPESAYVGGSCASNYSFGMPMNMPMGALPYGFPTSIATTNAVAPPMNTLVGTQVMPTVMSSAGSPKARVISTTVGTTVGTSPAFTSTPFNPMAANGFSGYAPQYQPQQLSSSGYYYMPQGLNGSTFTSTMPFVSGAIDAGMQRLDLGSMLPTSCTSADVTDISRPGMITTVMLRNIPLKYNREALLEDMDNRGFAYSYDFFYLPIDFHTGNNVGYAFINFLNEDTVNRFKAIYDGLQLSADSAKICQVSEAKAQGKLKNIEQYRNSSVMSMEDKYQPVVFENGTRTAFPPPTRTLKPVKPRARPA